jgi:hypothetical protein
MKCWTPFLCTKAESDRIEALLEELRQTVNHECVFIQPHP